MSKLLYLDAFSGLAGDMIVGALADAGADREALLAGLQSLNLGAEYTIEPVKRRGIAALKFRVAGGETKAHRHLPNVNKIIDAADIPQAVRDRAKAVFLRLGEAEAKSHQVPLEKVHFHEVGAVDSISDIVGACLALHLLGVDEVFCSPVNTGSGTVNTEHGVLPIPAPATAALLVGQPIYARGPQMELTTPTGAALAVTWATRFGPPPPMTLLATGHGAGDRDFPEHANVVRVLLGESNRAPEATTITVIEANIDDASPQLLGHALDQLLAAGALDVTLSPLLMKKNRPGTLLRILATPESQEKLTAVLFTETTTLGVRLYPAERRVQERHTVEVETPYGTVRVKASQAGNFHPEYEDCRILAEKTGVPLKQILAAASAAYLKNNG